MSRLEVGRWHTRYRAGAPLDAARIAAWDAALDHLDPGELDAGNDEWVFVPRLEISTRLAADAGAAALRLAWEAALRDSLARLLGDGEADVVLRYRDRREAVADMLYRAAAGDLRRAWAWRAMALIEPGSGSLAAAQVVRRACVLLQREPAAILPTLARLLAAEAATAAFSLVAAALDEEDWIALVATAPQTAPLWACLARRDEEGPVTALPESTAVASPLLAWAARQPRLARRLVRPLAALLALELLPDAAGGRAERLRDAAHRALAALACCSAEAPQPPTAGAAVPARPGRAADRAAPVASPAVGETGAGVAPARADDNRAAVPAAPTLPEAPPLAPAVDVLATDWGGLLFLLHLLPSTDLLDWPAAAPPVAWRLWWLGRRLGVPAADPALRAFCGGWQPAAWQLDAAGELAADEATVLRIATIAASLQAQLAERLPQLPEPRLEYVCHRPAELRLERGWIEVTFAAQRADTAIRRAALDLDPGWLGWLGCVVRFVYE